MIDSFLLIVRALFAVFWAELISRTAGPLALRFLLEPLMASALAICDGIRDARSNRMPFLALVKDAGDRQERLLEGASVVSRVCFIAVGVDAICQYAVLNAFHPLQALIAGFLLACIPYVLVRGPAALIWQWMRQKPEPRDGVMSLMRRIFV